MKFHHMLISVCVCVCARACMCAEHEQALMRYMKLPKRKEEKSRVEANDELYNMRKKFHQVSCLLLDGYWYQK